MKEKEYIERYDEDFLGNKINIGDTVIFEAPGYRSFTIGEVITKAPKSCQIEYTNDWNYDGRKEIVRQGYDQIIKHPAIDTIEVIRCKDCKHATFYARKNDTCYRGVICEYQIGVDDENFFCSYGERKEQK